MSRSSKTHAQSRDIHSVVAIISSSCLGWREVACTPPPPFRYIPQPLPDVHTDGYASRCSQTAIYLPIHPHMNPPSPVSLFHLPSIHPLQRQIGGSPRKKAPDAVCFLAR